MHAGMRKAATGAALVAAFAAAQAAAPVPVPAVDLGRYVGEWRELASIPNFFQRRCVRETTARYTAQPDGQLQVDNRCVRDDGSLLQALGQARVVPGSGNARLDVSFFKLFGAYRFWFPGDYWVLALDEHYRWALIGSPNRRYGWVLARERRLTARELQAVKAAIAAQGYDACTFLTTPQTPEAIGRQPFCALTAAD